MKLCLLAVALALFCAVHGFSDNPEDQKKAEGMWKALGISSNDPKLQKHMEKMTVVDVKVSFGNGDAVIETRIPLPDGTCKPMKIVFKKGDDGKYYHKCRFGEKTVDVVETDGENYAIVDITIVRDGQAYQTSTLYVRDTESVAVSLVEQFKQRSEEKGYSPDQTKILPKGTAC
ncbi:extracellular fatty acid-binding protein-like [Lacerta agilis]|uniref:extracellular fatty acid-binding protein-like n=1 Tax=Lacerta agilis TaxID=80427 RepID=UPI001419BE67|nr:extracellular fatty acid-binding protein-like [Lacerta agilis]XP_032993643.1 extracellular fatty acid-binding protein-like [Lacerta agilis]